MGEKRNLALCAQTAHVVHTKENTEKLTEAVTRTRVDLNYVSFLQSRSFIWGVLTVHYSHFLNIPDLKDSLTHRKSLFNECQSRNKAIYDP